MNPDKTALLILDPQNDLTAPNGKLYGATKPVLDKFDVVSNINRLIETYRDTGTTIIFSPITFSEGYPEAGENPYGVMTAVIESGAMLKGTEGGDISDLFNREEEDIILERSAIIAFESTKLDEMLKEKGIETLILCGMLSDICVEGTMRTAYSKGFEVYTVIDATATLNLDKQLFTMEHNYPLFSKAIDTDAAVNLNQQPSK